MNLSYFLSGVCVLLSSCLFAQDVQLAKAYRTDIPISDYYVSEKYDGIRAIWTGDRLVTKNGHPIHAPSWFIKDLPKIWLDGELWGGRNKYQFVASTVLDNTPDDSSWRQIKYMIFDAPDYIHPFSMRWRVYDALAKSLNSDHIQAVQQQDIKSQDALYILLEEITNMDGEGLILHKKSALFASGRTGNLLKFKKFNDAEAVVVSIQPGKGKFKGMMGALVVKMPSGLRFKIGTGFSNLQRMNPPKVGEKVTYKYFGFTSKGLPRFASFLRVRPQE
ncbi:DNA ligase [Marinomonas balearica]|uniref:DNA ligase-1 n=1 Tax=Marinomonas balearica TaxID=491947 RepID=A0A4R6M9R9_9GAMM|nr:DNA ligase [Marinomonas balearica]TDO96939.1 DNA ligase-1 [Marinomonas balearica]